MFGQMPGDELAIAGAVVIGAGQHARTAAWHRRCRNSGRNGISPSAAISPLAHLVQDLARLGVLLGDDARGLGRRQIAQHAAAMVGSSHRHSSAVMMPSRPKAVLNQGTPA